MLTFLLATWLAAAPAVHVVQVSVANIYSRPTMESDVVSQAIYSSPVTVPPGAAHWTGLLVCARRPKDNWKD